jgi:hypothetical protein
LELNGKEIECVIVFQERQMIGDRSKMRLLETAQMFRKWTGKSPGPGMTFDLSLSASAPFRPPSSRSLRASRGWVGHRR